MFDENVEYCDESGISDSSAAPTPQKDDSPDHSQPKIRRINKRIRMKCNWNIDLQRPDRDIVLREASEGLGNNDQCLLKNIREYEQNESLKCLLNQEAQNILHKCFIAPKPGIAIVRELFWSKTELDYDKLFKNYKDQYDHDKVMEYLINNNLVMREKPSAKGKHADTAKQDFSRNKSMTDYYSGTSSNEQRLKDTVLADDGYNYKLSEPTKKALKQLYTLMYLGSPHSWIRKGELQQVLINDLADKETYPIDKNMVLDNASVVFQSEKQFSKYYESLEVLEQYEKECNEKNKVILLKDIYERYKNISDEDMESYRDLPEWLHVFTPAQTYINILTVGVELLLKKQDDKNINDDNSNKENDVSRNIVKRRKKTKKSTDKSINSQLLMDKFIQIAKRNDTSLNVKTSETPKKETDNPISNIELASNILTALKQQTIFGQDKRAAWYCKLIKIYEKEHQKVAELYLEVLESDLPEECKHVLLKPAKFFVEKGTTILDDELKITLKEKLASIRQIMEKDFPAKHIKKTPLPKKEKSNSRVLFKVEWDDGSTKDVNAEYCCIHHYIYEDGTFTDGQHWEGRLVTTLFFLLFWDIIYTKPPNARGIFMSYYQKYPSDIYNKAFYDNRKELIDERIKNIEKDNIENLVNAMQQVLAERPIFEVGEQYREVAWACVRAAVRVLGARRVALLCARLARRGLHALRGFPDLTLWNTHSAHVRFVEVKTTDDPSNEQLQWMDYLQKNDFEVMFNYVGDKTQAKRRGNCDIDEMP